MKISIALFLLVSSLAFAQTADQDLQANLIKLCESMNQNRSAKYFSDDHPTSYSVEAVSAQSSHCENIVAEVSDESGKHAISCTAKTSNDDRPTPDGHRQITFKNRRARESPITGLPHPNCRRKTSVLQSTTIHISNFATSKEKWSAL